MDVTKKLDKYKLTSWLQDQQDIKLSKGHNPADTILIGGYFRSGTTYLMELLGSLTQYRTFFEPLHYSVKETTPFQNEYSFPIDDKIVKEISPYIEKEAENHELDPLFDSVLKGQITSPWIRKGRDYSNRKNSGVLLKLVRANLCFPYLVNKFSCKGIFIHRHPIAVIHSILRDRGIKTVLEDEQYLEVLLSQQTFYEKYVLEHKDSIEKYRKDPLGRVTLAYIISHLPFLENEFEIPSLTFVLSYEDLVLKQKKVLEDLSEFLNITNKEITPKASVTSKKDRVEISDEERVFSWKKQMEKEQIEYIEKILSEFPVCGKLLAKTT